ncbi:unnamed protein product, partial [Iphiclides podalirius]
MLRRKERSVASERDALTAAPGRELARSRSGIESVRVRLRIAFPYRVTAPDHLSRFPRRHSARALSASGKYPGSRTIKSARTA